MQDSSFAGLAMSDELDRQLSLDLSKSDETEESEVVDMKDEAFLVLLTKINQQN